MSEHKVIPVGWVYSLADYRQMFDLSEHDLAQSILDFPGGISSFNAEMHAFEHKVVSGDDIYDYSPSQMQIHSENILQANKSHLRDHLEVLINQDENYVEAIFAAWEQSKTMFVQDYELGKLNSRYLPMWLPKLPFKERQFNLALCSDLLFHGHAKNGHTPLELIKELCRVALEVRVFPLLSDKGKISDELGPVMMELHQHNFGVEVRQVPYEQQRGGNAMLRIWTTECVVK